MLDGTPAPCQRCNTLIHKTFFESHLGPPVATPGWAKETRPALLRTGIRDAGDLGGQQIRVILLLCCVDTAPSCWYCHFRLYGSRQWRNWQTHQLEGLAVEILWEFDPPLPHHPTKGTMEILLKIIHIVASIFLVLVVLLQSGRGGGMGAAFGGASGQIFGGRGAGSFLTRLTSGSAIVFFLTSLTLSMISSRHRSVLMHVKPPVSAPAADGTAGTTGTTGTAGTGTAAGTAADAKPAAPANEAVKTGDAKDPSAVPAEKPGTPQPTPPGVPSPTPAPAHP